MARNAVLGLDLENVEWKPAEEGIGMGGELPSGILVAVLSEDAETGASTVLFKVPPGVASHAPEAHSVTQEQLLLEGDCQMGDIAMKPGTYLCFPPGMVHGPGSTENGFIVYVTNHGELDISFHENLKQGEIADL